MSLCYTTKAGNEGMRYKILCKGVKIHRLGITSHLYSESTCENAWNTGTVLTDHAHGHSEGSGSMRCAAWMVGHGGRCRLCGMARSR